MKKPDSILSNIELLKLIELLNTAQNMRIQLATFFGAGSILILGVGFSEHSVMSFLLGIIVALFFIYADKFILRGLYGYYIRAKRILQSEYPNETDTIFDTFRLFIVYREKKFNELERISQIPIQNERHKKIYHLPSKMPTILGFYVPLLIIVVESCIAYFLYFHLGWDLI